MGGYRAGNSTTPVTLPYPIDCLCRFSSHVASVRVLPLRRVDPEFAPNFNERDVIVSNFQGHRSNYGGYSYNRNLTHCKRGHEYVEGSFKWRYDAKGHSHRECNLCKRMTDYIRRNGFDRSDYDDEDWEEFLAELEKFVSA